MNDLIEKQFYDYLHNFLCEIKKSFNNDIKDIIDTKYSDIKKKEYIEEIRENIYSYKENFLGEISELDKLFNDKEIILLKDINLSTLWNKSDSDNKNAIIQYLKVFILIFETCNKNENNNNNKDNKDNKDDKNTEKQTNFEDLLKNSLLNNEENLKSFYKNLNNNKDNSIINLAQNIASELQQENDGTNNIMNLMNGNNGQGLNGLISKITGKIDEQMKNGNLKHSDLLNDAQKIMGQDGGLFENLFNGLSNNMGNMANMNNNNNNDNSNQNDNFVNENDIINNSKTKKPLVKNKAPKKKKKN